MDNELFKNNISKPVSLKGVVNILQVKEDPVTGDKYWQLIYSDTMKELVGQRISDGMRFAPGCARAYKVGTKYTVALDQPSS